MRSASAPSADGLKIRRLLKDKKPYRPRTLDRVKAGLDALDPKKFGLGKEPQGNSEYTMYQVKRGDQLRAIARDLLGSPDRADVIFEANLNKLDSPDQIYPGQMLRIPKLQEDSVPPTAQSGA